uniref:Aminotransferase-like plant mobile domain-containing protein n=1 Tax=Leersia perrieri TaxID=77586 RepID=A0A0D9XKE5_9ORYZ
MEQSTPKNYWKPTRVNVSGGSSSLFTKALHVARSRKMYQRKQLPGIAVSNSKKRSGIKGRKTEKEKIYTRCAPGIVSDMFVGLDDQQKELVQQMGFECLLSMRLTKLNKQFGAWLLFKLEPASGILFSGSRHELPLLSEDVSLTMGIPCGRKKILPAMKNEVKDVKDYICHIFQKKSFDELTITDIQKILDESFKRTMTAHEKIAFKTTFIIFVVTKFLAPLSVNNHISTRYMKPLLDIENIHTYNWASFVLDEIKAAAAALQQKICNRKSIGYINSCIIVPQSPSLSTSDCLSVDTSIVAVIFFSIASGFCPTAEIARTASSSALLSFSVEENDFGGDLLPLEPIVFCFLPSAAANFSARYS